MDITKDIRPLTEFKRNTAAFVSHLEESGRPSVLTVNGKPSVVVMGAQAWQAMQDRVDHAETVAGIRDGLTQARRGEGTGASAFFDGLANGK